MKTRKYSKEILTKEDFHKYSQLLNEQMEIKEQLQQENREPNGKEAARLHKITELLSSFDSRFALAEAQHFATFTVEEPTYLPKGFIRNDQVFLLDQGMRNLR